MNINDRGADQNRNSLKQSAPADPISTAEPTFRSKKLRFPCSSRQRCAQR
jgi:hypothetical protein